MKKVNLEIIYRKVKQRIKRACSDNQRDLAIQATEAASVVKNNPTLNSVTKFRRIENKWLKTSTSRSISIADEFEDVIRSKNYYCGSIYNSYSTGFNPEYGYLYCFFSNDYPSIVKIGSTANNVTQRLLTYKARHKLDHLEELISIYTKSPSKKEHMIHDLLHEKMRPPETIMKSTEWFEISKNRAAKLIKASE